MSEPSSPKTFYDLGPETILEFVESQGHLCTGEMIQLNSYENRVFEVKLEDGGSFITKFYRPYRWSMDALLEEHNFVLELAEQDLNVITPVLLKNNSTVEERDGIYCALFTKFRGRLPDELLQPHYYSIGQLLARIHNVGSQKEFLHRPTMTPENHPGWTALDRLEGWVHDGLDQRYEEAAETILEFLEEELPQTEFLRLHGDLHRGNLLEVKNTFAVLDFDDCVNGPVVQDLWMLAPGEDEETQRNRDEFLRGYEQLRLFPENQMDLIPALRGLRILGYAAWIADRWQDPFFPKIFPQFNSYNYWAEEVEALEAIAWDL